MAVLAKAPVPGRVKTRLCPPLTPAQAAELARAALLDTIEACSASAAREVVVILDGSPRPWMPAGIRVIAQRQGDLGNRLLGAVVDLDGRCLVVGMDTPQLTADLIDDGLRALDGEGYDAVLGPALDGGYWAIGLRRADPRAFDGVPMSQPDTGRHQRAALDRLGLRVRTLRTLRDVDDHADAVAVAAEAPTTRFARALAELGPLPSSRDATGSPTRSPTTGTESRR